MAWLEGLLSGFSRRKGEVEALNLDEAHRSQERESKVYETLINSPDPDIKAAAITGLLQSAQPQKRKSGFKGWLGEMEAHPAYARIQELVNTPVDVQEPTYGLPSRQTTGFVNQLPGEAPLAQSTNSPTEAGAPPPTPITPSAAITREVPAPVTGTRTVQRPRQVLRTPLETATDTAAGQYGGRVEGIVQAIERTSGRKLTPEEIKQIGLELSGFSGGSGVGSAPFQSIAGEVVNPDGSVTPSFAVFDRSVSGGQYVDPITHQPLPTFRPKTGATARFGVTREAIAKGMFGKNFADLTQDEAGQVITEERTQAQLMASARATGSAQGQFQGPIDVATAARTGTEVGSSSADYSGQRVGTVQQQQRRQVATTIRDQLAHIKTLLGPLPKATDVVGGIAPGAVMAVRQRTPAYREPLAQLTSAINNIRASLTRTMQANVGTETEKDAERALSTLADFEGRLLDPLRGDTQESAGLRIDETLKYLDEVMASIPGTPVQVGAPPPTPAATAPTSRIGAAPPSPAGGATTAAGPAGYTVNEQGQLLLNGQPVP